MGSKPMWAPPSHKERATLGLIAIAALILLWLFLTWKPLVSPLFLPGPAQAYAQLRQGPTPAQWLSDLLASNFRVIAGFLIAAVVSIPLGVVIGSLPRVDALLSPVIEMMRYTPVPALLPLCILWFGVDEAQKILVIVLGTAFQLTVATAFAVRNVPAGFIETGLTLGLSRWNTLIKIVFPAAATSIYDSVRVSFGWAWSYLVVAEIVGSSGIGYRLMASQRYLQTGLVFGGIAELAALGWLSDFIFRRLRGVLLPWVP